MKVANYINMNWYKKIEFVIKQAQEFPSAEELAYFTGQYEDYEEGRGEREQEEEDFDEQRRNRERRHEKITKIRLNEEAMQNLEKKLLDPFLTWEQRKKINLQIGKHRGAISHIQNSIW